MALEGSFGAITEKAKGALEKVFISADQLVKLVGDMLNLSRIETGRIQYEFKKNDLVLLTKSVVGEYTPEVKKKGLRLVFKNDLGKTFEFLFDKDKIREVIINLVHNALKYTPKGAITLHLAQAPKAAGTDDDGNAGVLISVQDEGIGIKKEDISKLFIKFNRTEEVKKMDPNGMGIGLYFVKRVVEDHGGRAWAESEGLGKGSTFIVELPVKQ
jgi:signal transduction histidine kinase